MLIKLTASILGVNFELKIYGEYYGLYDYWKEY